MSISYRDAVEKEIEDIISRSEVPEDYAHAKSVKKWVLRFRPDSDWELQLAALAHDIERAFPERKVKRSEFSSYDDFKRAHAANSARIVKEILDRYSLSLDEKSRILHLIENHEFGSSSNPDLNVLRDADSVSFFEVNLPFYARRHDKEEVFFRMEWGFERLSDKARQIIKKINYEDNELNGLLKRLLK